MDFGARVRFFGGHLREAPPGTDAVWPRVQQRGTRPHSCQRQFVGGTFPPPATRSMVPARRSRSRERLPSAQPRCGQGWPPDRLPRGQAPTSALAAAARALPIVGGSWIDIVARTSSPFSRGLAISSWKYTARPSKVVDGAAPQSSVRSAVARRLPQIELL